MKLNGLLRSSFFSKFITKYRCHGQRTPKNCRFLSSNDKWDKNDMLKEKFNAKCFGGRQKVIAHFSDVTNCEMRFAIYLPEQSNHRRLPVLYFLSGLSMDHVDFIEKSGSQRIAAELGIILVAPDSSPRNTNIPGENDKWNIGTKASYYIDATEEPWSKHYKMYSYISKELPSIVNKNFPTLPNKRSIMGFSIGGHGAFVIKMNNPDQYCSVSALAPVCDITVASHSVEGLELYLGRNENNRWDRWSAVNIAKNYKSSPFHILIDQGSADKYLKEDLHTDDFINACKSPFIDVTYNLREDYTHNYYFLKTFLPNHIEYHMRYLR